MRQTPKIVSTRGRTHLKQKPSKGFYGKWRCSVSSARIEDDNLLWVGLGINCFSRRNRRGSAGSHFDSSSLSLDDIFQ